MKILNAAVHGALDFAVVVVFALAPTLLGFTGLPATLCYVLAVVHLALTLVTRFRFGVLKLVPLLVHGYVELVVAPVLLALPFLFGFEGPARLFFPAAGVVVFVTWLLTRYADARTA